MRESVSNGACRLTLNRERTERFLHPGTKVLQQWPGASLAFGAANLHGLATNLLLDSIQGSDARQRLSGRRGSMNHMDVMEFTPAVSSTGDLVDGSVAIKMMESCVGIGLQCTSEAVQMLPRMFAFAVLRIG